MEKFFLLVWLLCTLSLSAQSQRTGDFEIRNRVLVKYRGMGGEVLIPPTLKIDRIGRRAFAGAPVKALTIPLGVGFIDEQAFAECSFLETVSLPNTLIRIGEKAFFNCLSLKQINWPISLLTIEDRAFFNCRSMENLVLPGVLKYIGSNAFSGCIGLRTLSLSRRTGLGRHPFIGVRCEITYRD
ncbi:MAG: leucine-rich repeat domain-containing protein [Spirochaetaceae bacterium]|jgi:hypothetical protein|nr:leucine-rich repeat domain-containing protein [Spirochaetaceae bacterium]